MPMTTQYTVVSTRLAGMGEESIVVAWEADADDGVQATRQRGELVYKATPRGKDHVVFIAKDERGTAFVRLVSEHFVERVVSGKEPSFQIFALSPDAHEAALKALRQAMLLQLGVE